LCYTCFAAASSTAACKRSKSDEVLAAVLQISKAACKVLLPATLSPLLSCEHLHSKFVSWPVFTCRKELQQLLGAVESFHPYMLMLLLLAGQACSAAAGCWAADAARQQAAYFSASA
jgi:hypothetical protein